LGLLFGENALRIAGRWGVSPAIPKAILLITDGANNEPPDPLATATAIKDNGTEIFVIGITGDGSGGDGDYDETTMLQVCSDPKEGVHYFNVTYYGDLQTIINEVAYGLCYSRGGSASPSLYLLFLLLIPLAAGVGLIAFVWRRRKPKKVVAPPPEPEIIPEPVPVKAAAPVAVTDKPKDWTVPGTRYIGFGQANIKVKWGADAPPSAPRGHDKYDRWSMQHQGGPLPPLTSPSSKAALLPLESDSGSGAVASPGRAPPVSCCVRFCPCCLLGGRAPPSSPRGEDEGNWQENPASPKSTA